MNEPDQMHEQTIDDLILVKEYGKCPGDELAWRGLHVEMGSFTDLADWLDSFVESGACGYAYQGDAFSDSTNSMATWVSCLADKIRRMVRLQNADALRERRREVTDTDEAITGNGAKMREALIQIRELTTPCEGVTSIELQVNAIACSALAEPQRNGDEGTAEEQENRFRRYCNSRGMFCGNCPLYDNRRGECRFAWAQMPYEEGGEE